MSNTYARTHARSPALKYARTHAQTLTHTHTNHIHNVSSEYEKWSRTNSHIEHKQNRSD